jgi:type II secretory pathway component GspD/PulD (secretin)
MSVPGGPSLRTRRAATEFNARSGQTLVLAGFLSRESALQRDGLPAVSRIPVLGRLFGLDRRQHRETELAIFVTPVLVDPDNPGVLERVRSAQGVLDHAFPADVPPSGGLLEAAVLPEPLAPDGAASWDPWSGQGSQWHADEVGTTDSVRRNGANKYAFTD